MWNDPGSAVHHSAALHACTASGKSMSASIMSRQRIRGSGGRGAMSSLRPIWRVVVACAALLAPTAAVADPVADFYHGKTINLYVSFPPGGGYDIYARVLVPYFTRHIPGNPAIIIKNMEGGSGV